MLLAEEAGLVAVAERKRREDLTEEEKLALLGRPRLGDITRAQIRVKESKEFKVRFKIYFKSRETRRRRGCADCSEKL